MSLEHSPARSGERYAFTINEFCDAHRISRSKFYLLRKQGLAPEITDIDGKQIIFAEHAAKWRTERKDAAIDEGKERARKRSENAVRRAAERKAREEAATTADI
jgi:hypothetical protein